MESMMARLKSAVESQKGRQKSAGRTFNMETEGKDSEFIKVQTKKIIDILLPEQDPPESNEKIVSLFQQVSDVLKVVLGKGREKKKEPENSKKVEELENLVNESEREKVDINRFI
jgi:hypothetical protein